MHGDSPQVTHHKTDTSTDIRVNCNVPGAQNPKLRQIDAHVFAIANVKSMASYLPANIDEVAGETESVGQPWPTDSGQLWSEKDEQALAFARYKARNRSKKEKIVEDLERRLGIEGEQCS
jgi:hypothetical protein